MRDSTIARREWALVSSRALAVVCGCSCWLFAGCGSTTTDGQIHNELSERPLQLPEVAVDDDDGLAGRCVAGGPTEVGVIDVPGYRGEGALGPWPGMAELRRGPAYVALRAGPPRVVYLTSTRNVGGDAPYVVPTLWMSRDGYSGPLRIRGGRTDGDGRIGFGLGGEPMRELTLPEGYEKPWSAVRARGGSGWRMVRVPTRLQGPGCYAFQVDGQEFSYTLSFGVQSK